MAKKTVKSFEQICAEKGISAALPNVSMLPVEHQKGIIAFYKLTIIAEYLNGAWRPDYADPSQNKYWPYGWVITDASAPTGFAFDDASYDYAATCTGCGARLCYKNSKLALQAINDYAELYLDFFLYTK